MFLFQHERVFCKRQTGSHRTQETVDLAVLRGDALVFIDQIAGTQRLRAVSSIGEAFPLTSTANGKACLALLDGARAQGLGARGVAAMRHQRQLGKATQGTRSHRPLWCRLRP